MSVVLLDNMTLGLELSRLGDVPPGDPVFPMPETLIGIRRAQVIVTGMHDILTQLGQLQPV